MAVFVLIHGSWHGGWCFDQVSEALRAGGHHAFAPTLPGMGGSEDELGAVTLAQWGEFVAAECRALKARHDEPLVLAGHSRGGLVISEAGERAPEAVDALVYICAMMLPNGMSRASFKEREGANPAFDRLISPTPSGSGTLITGEDPGSVFAQLSPRSLVKEAMSRLVAEPHGPRSTPLTVSSDRWGSIPRTYVECLDDRTIPIASQRAMQDLCPGACVVTLDADHSPYLSRPVELAAALVGAIPGS